MEKEYYKRKMEENYQREICQREYIIERYEEKLKEKECTIQRLQGKEQDIVYVSITYDACNHVHGCIH